MTDARIVIIGGGIAGASLAYHLAQAGSGGDVLLLEQDQITSGSTWHAAGLCTQYIGSHNLARLLRYSIELYRTLEDETGQKVDFHPCGSLRLGATPEHLDEFRSRAGIAEAAGIPFEIVSADRARELFPLLDTGGLLGAAYLPTDGHVDPTSVANALVQGAVAGGLRIRRRTRVVGLSRDPGGWRIETPGESLRAKIVVNAAGQWAREVGRMAGIELPIVSMQHEYATTDAVPELRELDRELPVLRDPMGSYYVREEGEGLLVGPFERSPVPWALDGIPEGFHGRLLAPDVERIQDCLAAAAERVPAFGRAGIKTVVNGPDGYTPDGRCLMGPAPGLPDFFVLAGFSIFGIVFGGGAGRYAAEWILEGQPSDDMWELDVRRFGPYASAPRYTVALATDVYEREYAIHFPHEERPAGRPLKTGPLYDRLLARGAVYGARFGWERPLWFATDGDGHEEDRGSFGWPAWHEAVGRECRGVRDGVGILDQTSFAKYEVSGPGAVRFLDLLCANALPGRIGRMALTQMCTPRGGVICDLTVTRLAADRFYVVSAAATETHDLAWMTDHLPQDGSVRLDNVSAALGVLTLAGPNSRALLQRITDTDVGSKAFPFFTAREMVAGMAPVRALRVSYVGELGYELHHPAEYQRHLYDALVGAGGDLGLVDFGYHALESMRLEKGYRLWGADLSPDHSPVEAGLGRFVRLGKEAFVGRDALLEQRRARPAIELACLAIDAEAAPPHGQEPVFHGADLVGYLTSGGYGHRIERAIGLAYLPRALARPGTHLSVTILGERRSAIIAEAPLYDPGDERLRA